MPRHEGCPLSEQMEYRAWRGREFVTVGLREEEQQQKAGKGLPLPRQGQTPLPALETALEENALRPRE